MKTFAIAAIAFISIATPMAQAQPVQHHRQEFRKNFRPSPPPHARPHVGPRPHVAPRPSWRAGNRLPPHYRNQHVRDYRRLGLRAPARGQRWVRIDNQYVLINAATGLIMSLSAAR